MRVTRFNEMERLTKRSFRRVAEWDLPVEPETLAESGRGNRLAPQADLYGIGKFVLAAPFNSSIRTAVLSDVLRRNPGQMRVKPDLSSIDRADNFTSQFFHPWLLASAQSAAAQILRDLFHDAWQHHLYWYSRNPGHLQECVNWSINVFGNFQ